MKRPLPLRLVTLHRRAAFAGLIFLAGASLQAANAAVPKVLTAAEWAGIRAAHQAALQENVVSPITQQAYVKASNTGEDDQFGYSVAVSGDTVVVGAYSEDSNATGINGDQSDNSQVDAGAAYVFVREGDSWTQQAYLKASNAGALDCFGWSVAVSGDTVVIGADFESSNATGVNGDQDNNSAFNSGAAYVFVREGTTWSQQAYLKASNTGADDRFGISVAVSGDTLVVGASVEASSATGINGNQADNSARFAGAAYIFVRDGAVWTQQAYVKASNTDEFDAFGVSVAVSGNIVVVGADEEQSDAIGINGNQSDNSLCCAGAAYIFVRNGVTWTQQAYVKASNNDGNDSFGASVAVSGETVVVGAYLESGGATGINGDQTDMSAGYSGAAYIFVRNGVTWTQQAYVKASNTEAGDSFGGSVAVSGDILVIGAIYESSNATGINGNQADNSARFAGAAYIFVRDGAVWTQQAYVKASNTGADDYFGHSVAVSGNAVIVGARFEDSNAIGIDGDESDNSALGSGAAYIFNLSTTFGNISTRMRVGTGDNVLIGGFIVNGTEPKPVLLRAIGPSLPLAGSLADPMLELHDGAGALLASNDDWMDAPNKQAIIDTSLAPANDQESAIFATLDPGAYTAITRGVNNSTGIGLVEAYDLESTVDSELANISTRGLVQTGDDVMIGGFILLGPSPEEVLVRAIGPSLPLAGKLADPTLELFDGNGVLLVSNDNWRDTQEAEIMATMIAPSDDAESAILQTLLPAAYTAIVRGKNETTGIALIDVYNLGPGTATSTQADGK